MRSRLTVQKTVWVLSALIIISVGVIVWALASGAIDISVKDVARVFLKWYGLDHEPLDETIYQVVSGLRLKRVLLAFLIGMSLSVSGAIFQALLRNPLADPHILGASAGGALGAVLASVCGFPVIMNAFISLPIFSFFGSLAAILIVYSLARRKGILSMYSLILVGVILNSFFISVVIFIESIVSADQLSSIFFWLLGNLSQCDERVMFILAVLFAFSFVLLYGKARAINLLSLGEEKAAQLGVPVESTKRLCFIVASVITGMSVAVSGLIGFVGLVVPHIVRLLFGPDHRLLLPASALLGGIFLVVSDTIARTIIIPQELPVGVVTSFIGAPFFIFLLKRKEETRFF
jgi:iron complex transport system permease protein